MKLPQCNVHFVRVPSHCHREIREVTAILRSIHALYILIGLQLKDNSILKDLTHVRV